MFLLNFLRFKLRFLKYEFVFFLLLLNVFVGVFLVVLYFLNELSDFLILVILFLLKRIFFSLVFLIVIMFKLEWDILEVNIVLVFFLLIVVDKFVFIVII